MKFHFISFLIAFILMSEASGYETNEFTFEYQESALDGTIIDPITATTTIATVGVVLRTAIKDFQTTGRNLGAQFGNEVNNSIANANNVAIQLESELGRKLDKTVGELKESQQRIAYTAYEVAVTLRKKIEEINQGVTESLKYALGDADITIYNLASNFKRSKVSRIVYLQPAVIDMNRPINFIKIRGNFLNLISDTPIYVNNFPVKPIAKSDNEITLEIPKEMLLNLTEVKYLSITTKQVTKTKKSIFGKNKIQMGIDQSLGLMIKPTTSFRVEGEIIPSYSLPQFRTFSISVYDRTSSSSENRVEEKRYHSDDPSEEIVDYQITNEGHQIQCGSGIESHQKETPKAVYVKYRVKGCGRSWGFEGKGGWVGFEILLNMKKYSESVNRDSFRFIDTQRKNYYEFTYPLNLIPTEKDNLIWKYNVRVYEYQGDSQINFTSVSQENQMSGKVKTALDNGKLRISIE